VLLSGYASPLYEDLYGDWHQARFDAFTGNATDGRRTEVVWSNRPLRTAAVHDALPFTEVAS
jgi:DNA adenine methylase